MLRHIILTAIAALSVVVGVSAQGMTLEEAYEHRQNRGLVRLDNPIIPKGLWIVGASASYSTHTNDNYTLALIEGINSTGYTTTASPIVAYTFKDNMSVGLRFEYSRSLLDMDSALLSVGEEGSSVELSAVDYYSLQHSYTAMALFRQYIPLGYAKRFALFVETRLEVGGKVTKAAFDRPVVGTFSDGYTIGLGVVPGVVAFATDFIAFEVMVGMMGVHYSYMDQTHNQVYMGTVESSSMNFKVNLLTIGLGVSFYL